MDVVNCPRCGRIFTRISKPVCPACVKEDEDTFEMVRGYIKDNPMCSMTELSEATHVSVKRITQYIRDGRLEITKGMDSDLTCTLCGRPILTGRFCKKCAMDIKLTALEKNPNDDLRQEIKRSGSMHVNRNNQ